MTRRNLILATVACLVCNQAAAVPVIFQGQVSQRGEFYALVNPSVIYTETFESVAGATPDSPLNHGRDSFTLAGTTYTALPGGGDLVVTGPPVNYGNFGSGVNYGAGLGHVTTGVLTAGGEEYFEVNFNAEIDIVAMDVLLNGRVNNGRGLDITFYHYSEALGVASWLTENDVRFLGFKGDKSVTRFVFDSYAGSQTNTGIDNLTTAQAPSISVTEPGSLALLGMGLSGLGFARRKHFPV